MSAITIGSMVKVLAELDAARVRQGGFRGTIYEDARIVEKIEDWSRVRSPGRARRRRKRYPQKIVTTYKPAAIMLNGALYVHPAIMADLRRNMAANGGLDR